jgi:hypothetical protein
LDSSRWFFIWYVGRPAASYAGAWTMIWMTAPPRVRIGAPEPSIVATLT